MKIDVANAACEVAVPGGFEYAGVTCGIKKSGKLDLALIHAPSGCRAAGVYTTNLVHAASIDWDRERTPSEAVRGVVINSGNANACTGQRGESDNRTMAELAAQVLGCEPDQVLVLSTGVIGQHLPIDRVKTGIHSAADSLEPQRGSFLNSAAAICTTDAFVKIASREIAVDGRTFRIAGMAKGAGMIGPRMATMLGVLTTDFPIDATSLDRLLRDSVEKTFNCISVDGHMSTNDAVLALSSGPSAPVSDHDRKVFAESFGDVCEELARMIPIDGEGATHLIEIRVRGCDSNAQADCIARSVAASPLVKTAMTGNDPNWGRIVSAAGYAGVPFDPSRVQLALNGHPVFSKGQPLEFDAAMVSRSLGSNLRIEVELTVGDGPGAAVHWTSDLTVEYVRFNSEYTT